MVGHVRDFAHSMGIISSIFPLIFHYIIYCFLIYKYIIYVNIIYYLYKHIKIFYY